MVGDSTESWGLGRFLRGSGVWSQHHESDGSPRTDVPKFNQHPSQGFPLKPSIGIISPPGSTRKQGGGCKVTLRRGKPWSFIDLYYYLIVKWILTDHRVALNSRKEGVKYKLMELESTKLYGKHIMGMLLQTGCVERGKHKWLLHVHRLICLLRKDLNKCMWGHQGSGRPRNLLTSTRAENFSYSNQGFCISVLGTGSCDHIDSLPGEGVEKSLVVS